MNHLVMISLALLFMTGVASVRDGYIAKPENCAYHCIPGSPGCNTLCKEKKATSGHCGWKSGHGTACWCNDLPDKEGIIVDGKGCTRR
uniref:Sodium channel toxin NaTx10 n=1 Tax=Odontobuthus doriae TaxID=342590 RepID=A0A0U4Q545_ODODO|nr:sodium channel toxin NaTx10 [Odontobuthus doriae]